MSSNSGGVGKLLSISVLLIVAVGALAVLNMDLFGLRTRLLGAASVGPTPLPNAAPVNDPRRGPLLPPELVKFDPTRPDDTSWLAPRTTPLPPTLTITRKVGTYTTNLELVLVPGGSFPMGEDDGVDSNQPKRWVKCSDFYIARTEMTNEQYYAFILDNGYLRSQYWTKAGFDFARGNDMAGTELIGWSNLDEEKRLWALSAPQGDLTLELRGKDGNPGRANAPVLVLPTGDNWSDYFQYDPIARQATIRGHNDKWVPANGDDVVKMQRLSDDRLLYMTDFAGRVYIPNLATNQRYTIVTWPDGNLERPGSGLVSRSESNRLRGPTMPVVSMTWFEADACSRWWGGQLPYECWWEKAARGVDGRHFAWGNDLDLTVELFKGGPKTTPYANFNRQEVKQVGSFPGGASQLGLQDLVGNVAEWVHDSFTLQPLADPRFASIDPHVDGGPRESRSERGSSTFDDDPQTAKLHNRRRSDPFGYNRGRGFRIAFSVEAALKAANGG